MAGRDSSSRLGSGGPCAPFDRRIVRARRDRGRRRAGRPHVVAGGPRRRGARGRVGARFPRAALAGRDHPDRKSTRLNSSHITISYAVFCLKKKKKNNITNKQKKKKKKTKT